MKKITAFLLIVSCCLASGCGFHLLNSQSLKETYPTIALLGDKRDIFYKKLYEELQLKDIEIIEVEGDFNQYLEEDIPVLSCSKPDSKISTLSVSGNSQDLEYNYSSSVTCLLYKKGKEPYTIKNVVNRSFLHKAGTTIASDVEKDDIKKESQYILIKKILFRLQNSQYLKLNNLKVNNSEQSEDQEIKFVFNATDANENTKEYRITQKELNDIKNLTNPQQAQEQLELKKDESNSDFDNFFDDEDNDDEIINSN